MSINKFMIRWSEQRDSSPSGFNATIIGLFELKMEQGDKRL